MAIDIEVRDYGSASDLEDGSSCAYGDIHYTGPSQDPRVQDPESDGVARFSMRGFSWWIGCQHAIKLVWSSGEEVILKATKNCKLKSDKEGRKQVLDYFRKLIDNKFKYTPFGEPELKLELSGSESEFMDI